MTLYLQAPFRYMEILEEQVYRRKINTNEFVTLIEDFMRSCTNYALEIINNSHSISNDDENEFIAMMIHAELGDLFLTSHQCSIVELVQEYKCVANTIINKLGDNLISHIGSAHYIDCEIEGSIVKIEIM